MGQENITIITSTKHINQLRSNHMKNSYLYQILEISPNIDPFIDQNPKF
jgi:hypothetical protein